jgi:hypothetical protein
VAEVDVTAAGPGELAKALVGPSGNLRAPAARVGRDLLVGFSPEAWRAALL